MYDVIIIGAGPAGLSAAYWCDDLGLDALVLESESDVGGQLHHVFNPINNYPGLSVANGRELIDKFTERLDAAEFDLWTQTEIENVDLKTRQVALRTGEKLHAIAIIIATGVRRKTLNIPGEKEFVGKGIIESAARDAQLFAGEDVCVVGGGDAAAENALALAEVCPTVTLVHRGKKLRARAEFRERLATNHRITVFTESNLTRIIGDDHVSAVEVKRDAGLKPFQIAVRGVLIRVGSVPNSELFAGQIQMDEASYIKVNELQETSSAFVFAIGDVANPLSPTVSTAVGGGATAVKVIGSRLNTKERR